MIIIFIYYIDEKIDIAGLITDVIEIMVNEKGDSLPLDGL